MKQKNCWILWLCLYLLCLIGGFIPNPVGFGKVLLILFSVCFFIPGAMLLFEAQTKKNRKLLFRLRMVSLSSLIITTLFIILNFLSYQVSEVMGIVLHIFLVFVSVPMFAFQYWAGSLFLWSCLFIGTFVKFYRQ